MLIVKLTEVCLLIGHLNKNTITKKFNLWNLRFLASTLKVKNKMERVKPSISCKFTWVSVKVLHFTNTQVKYKSSKKKNWVTMYNYSSMFHPLSKTNKKSL